MLRRDRTLVSRSSRGRVGTTPRRVVLRRRHGHPFALGAYTLVVRGAGRVVAQRAVRLGGHPRT